MPTYRDLDLDLTRTDVNDVAVKDDIDAIKQSVKMCVLTERGSRARYQLPEFGSDVPTHLFEKINSITVHSLKGAIEEAIDNWEPRVRVIDINISQETRNSILVKIQYEIINLRITDEVTLELEVIK
jgi:hypothetical protein